MTSTHAKKPGTIHIYLGDGINLIVDGSDLSLSASRTGERPITLRPAVFKRLLKEGMQHIAGAQASTIPLLERLIERSFPTEELEPESAPIRTIPLLTVARSRDDEMAEWELTLRRKREALAKPRPEGPGAPKPLKPISELA